VAGDSLGSLVEFRSERDIARQYPEGVRDLADGGTWNTIAGQPTDDSELALDLARTLVSQTSWSSEAVAAAYAGWYASRPFDIGGTTRQALSAAAATAQDKARAARKAANRESQANGALMRCAPIGIWARDAAEAAAAARQDAALTHPHPICQAASAAFVAAIATGIGGGDREAMLTSAEAAMPEPDASPLRAALARARAGEGPGDFMSQQGWVLIAFQNAFRHLAAGTSIEDALIETAGAGGDTDTNGAICGALLGAAQGSAAVPSRWSMAVLACRPAAELGALRPRPARYWPDDLQTLAEALMTRRLSSPPETHAQTERKATVILPSTAPGCGTEDTNRRCLRDPIPEIFEAARYLRCAVAKHMAGDHERAADLFRAANMSEIRQWTESIWGKQNPKILQFREVSGSPALLPPNLRAPSRMPSADVRKCLITRFGYNCAFCGIPLVRRHVRERIFRCYPDAVMWGTRNESQHAAFQAMWLQFDHVLPYARGGDNSAENLLITCSPCNYGRMNYTLKELGLADPRDRPANKTEWDGLEGFR
jgi:ADP-ribosylglycohydrolase